MTEPNQVRPIMQIVNQVRELIIDAYYAGEAKRKKLPEAKIEELLNDFEEKGRWELSLDETQVVHLGNMASQLIEDVEEMPE